VQVVETSKVPSSVIVIGGEKLASAGFVKIQRDAAIPPD
jgi:hypothetical protein